MRKVCNICKVEKDISEFAKSRTNADGRLGFCKACAKKRYEKEFDERHYLDTALTPKICSVCGEEKTSSEFSRRKESVDGYRKDCKKCANKYEKKDKSQYLEDFKKGLKVCTKCGEKKELKYYDVSKHCRDGLSSMCKECKKKYVKTFDKSYYLETENNLRVCKSCGVEKKCKEFGRRDNIDGYRGECKECYNRNHSFSFSEHYYEEVKNDLKECVVCKTVKPLKEFYRASSSKDGHFNSCIECNKEYYNNKFDDQYYIDSKDNLKVCKECGESKKMEEFSITRSNDDGYTTKCKECCIIKNNVEFSKEYYKKTENNLRICRTCYSEKPSKEFIKRSDSIDGYGNECKDCERTYYRMYRGLRKNNKKNKIDKIFYYEEKQKIITAEDIDILDEITIHCEVCNIKMNKEGIYPSGRHLDHIIPQNIGGLTILENVRYICSKCNLDRPKDGRDLIGTKYETMYIRHIKNNINNFNKIINRWQRQKDQRPELKKILFQLQLD